MNPATNRLTGWWEQRLGGVDLLEQAVADHRHPRAQGHGLDLVVGDVHDGGGQLLVQPGQLGPHLDPQLGVEVGQRLVHQEGLGLADHGPADGHPLALAAGQVGRLAGQVVEQGEDLGDPADLLGHHRLGAGPQLFQDRRELVAALLLRAGAAGLLQVHAGAEHGSRVRQHHHPHLVVRDRGRQVVPQLPV